VKKLISFSLWGFNPKYTIGAIRNAELAKDVYPGWKVRFYTDFLVPTSIICRLEDLGAEIVQKQEIGDWKALFWRFEPAGEPDVDVMISRDCDSRL
jgi:hypothetical protein